MMHNDSNATKQQQQKNTRPPSPFEMTTYLALIFPSRLPWTITASQFSTSAVMTTYFPTTSTLFVPGGTIDDGPVGTEEVFLGASDFFGATTAAPTAVTRAAEAGSAAVAVAGAAGAEVTVSPADKSFDIPLPNDFFLNIVGEAWWEETGLLRADEELLADVVPCCCRSLLFWLLLLLLLLPLLQQMKKSGKRQAVLLLSLAAPGSGGDSETVAAEAVAAAGGGAVRTSTGFNVVCSACCGWWCGSHGGMWEKTIPTVGTTVVVVLSIPRRQTQSNGEVKSKAETATVSEKSQQGEREEKRSHLA